jgi:hypothetical protein
MLPDGLTLDAGQTAVRTYQGHMAPTNEDRGRRSSDQSTTPAYPRRASHLVARFIGCVGHSAGLFNGIVLR